MIPSTLTVDDLLAITAFWSALQFTPSPKLVSKPSSHAGVWEQQRLGNITNRITRKNTHLESDIPLTLSAQYGLIDQNEFFNKRIASKDISGYYLVRNGEFAYNKSTSSDAPWGAIERLDRYDQGVLSTLYIVFGLKDPQEINSDYLVSYYQTNLWHRGIQAIASEGARNHGLLNITPADFFDTTISVPSNYREQSLIGSFFRKLDDLLALHQRQTKQLKKLKQGLLQNMFPREGESVPRLRFPGFTTTWKQQKLEDLFEYERPDKYIVKTTDYSTAQLVPVLTANKGFILGYTEEKEGIHDNTPTILFDDFTCDMKYVNFKFKVKSSAMKLLYMRDRAMPLRFGYELLKHLHYQPQSHSRHWISIMQSITTVIPSVEEQQKIADFFSTLDDLIHLHEQYTVKLTHLKKGLLQKMFPQD